MSHIMQRGAFAFCFVFPLFVCWSFLRFNHPNLFSFFFFEVFSDGVSKTKERDIASAGKGGGGKGLAGFATLAANKYVCKVESTP